MPAILYTPLPKNIAAAHIVGNATNADICAHIETAPELNTNYPKRASQETTTIVRYAMATYNVQRKLTLLLGYSTIVEKTFRI
jgi:hypothetical protein